MPARVFEHVVTAAGPDDGSQMAHCIYLHGFASSPQSGKVGFLSDRLADHGLTLRCPDLNDPDFSTLTVSRMIDQVEVVVGQLPSEPGRAVRVESRCVRGAALRRAGFTW